MMGYYRENRKGDLETIRRFGLAQSAWHSEDEVLYPVAKGCLERAGCEGKNAVMVGDKLDNDIAPAKRAEMKTVWVRQGFGRFSTPGNEMEKADFTVNDLDGVWKLFEGVFQ